MIVTAWNNGKWQQSGAGYGFKVRVADRDSYFSKQWTSVFITLPTGNTVAVNVAKRSFWDSQCRELISQHIGRWLIGHGLAPWPARKPPRLRLRPLGRNRFHLRGTN